MTYIKQKTIKNTVQLSGIGLHTGNKVTLTLSPAPENSGIKYIRTDIEQSIISDPFAVTDTMLCTCLSNDKLKIHTIEHLSAALSAFEIDNVTISLDSPEMPIMDGSSYDFIKLLEQAEVVEQNANKRYIKITKEVIIEETDKWAKLTPLDTNESVFDFTIDFDNILIKRTNNNIAVKLTKDNFITELSKARTFCLMKELEHLQSLGLCKGGSLDCAIVVDDEKIINPGELRYPDEFVRHKTLDAIGDLFVCGHTILGHYSAYKSGHALNNKLLQKLMSNADCWHFIELLKNNN